MLSSDADVAGLEEKRREKNNSFGGKNRFLWSWQRSAFVRQPRGHARARQEVPRTGDSDQSARKGDLQELVQATSALLNASRPSVVDNIRLRAVKTTRKTDRLNHEQLPQ